MKRWHIVVLIGFVVFLSALHCYKLDAIPPGLSNDEANIGYEAWSIATTGKDQWGRPWPIAFEGFGNWSLPVYIYLTAPLIRLFGPTTFAIRLLSTVSGATIVILTYFVVRRLRPQSLGVVLAASALVATTPWIIGLTRTATEAPLAMTFFMASLNLFLVAKNRSVLLLFSGFLAFLSLFTYYGMWVFAPMYWVSLWWFFRKQFAVSRQQLAIIGVMGAIGAFLIVKQQGGIARLRQVNLAGNPTILGMLNEERGTCQVTYPSILCQLIFNRASQYGSEFFKNYLSHFSLREWFLINDAKGILPPGGYFLPILAPLFAVGLFQLIVKGSKQEKVVLLSWFFLAPIADSFTSAGNFTRAFPMAVIIPIITGYGALGLGRWLGTLGALGVLGMFGQFAILYTSYFPIKHSPFTHYEYQPLVSVLKDEKQLPVYVSSAVRDTKQYIFYLWYAKILPRYFQESDRVVREPDFGGWVWVKQIDNWHFVKKLPDLLELPVDAIIVGAWKEEIIPFVELLETCDGSPRPLQTIDYLNGNPAFVISRLQRVGEVFCLVQ